MLARLASIAAGKNALALLDQAVVSGTNFLTTVLIGRWASVRELGVYSLGFSLLVAWTTAQDALIVLPYTIYRHRAQPGTQAQYAGSVLVHQGLLSALVMVVLIAVAAVLSWSGAVPGLASVTWVLAGVMPFACLREFGRRIAFAHLRVGQALLLDSVAAAAQLAGLAWLLALGTLSATSAYVAIGLACALSGGIWLYQARGNFVIRWDRVWGTLRRNWSLGKWLFAWQATLAVQAYFIHWLLAWLVGPTATGVYAACMTVVLFSNPFVLGIANALAPRAAHALNHGGVAELWRVIFHTTLLLGTAMGLFCIVVVVGGEWIMDLLYDGPQYDGHGHTVAVLALAMLASALGMPATNGLMAAERTAAVFKIALLALAVSVLLVPVLVIWFGLPGAAYGFLAGNVVGSVTRWLAFSTLVPRRGPWAGPASSSSVVFETDAVRQVVRQLLPDAPEDSLVIEPIGEGVQADVHAVRAQNQGPLWQGHSRLAIKLYRPPDGTGVELARGQFAALSRLHEAVNGRTIEGWTTLVPEPLYVSQGPQALVMTVAPGKELDWYLENDASLAPALLESAARAVVAALRQYWAHGQVYGALSFSNILCDLDGKQLWFIDAGLEAHSFLCDGVERRWYPASRDLAYMLYQTGVRVRRGAINPAARLRQERFAYAVLRTFVESLGSLEEKQSLLREVEACIQVHLRELGGSWSPRGLWRVLLRRLASRRIGACLCRFRAEAGVPCACAANGEGSCHA